MSDAVAQLLANVLSPGASPFPRRLSQNPFTPTSISPRPTRTTDNATRDAADIDARLEMLKTFLKDARAPAAGRATPPGGTPTTA
jgi:hypothetical protein